MAQRTGLMTIEDFIRLYDTEGPFELVDGEKISLIPDVAGQSVTVRAVFISLNAYCSSPKLGEVFMKCSYILTEDGVQLHGSRSPDLLFIEASRWMNYQLSTQDWRDKPLMLVPDLIVEAIAPDDPPAIVSKRASLYLGDGVQLVWIMDPWSSTVSSFAVGKSERLSGDDILTAPDILPGFALSLSALFA